MKENNKNKNTERKKVAQKLYRKSILSEYRENINYNEYVR